jgi:3-oxoacyl-(acyl-carrier-protein) synthase
VNVNAARDDSARAAARPLIAGRGIVTSLGQGLTDVWSAIERRECGLRTLERLPTGRYATDCAGEVSSEILLALVARDDRSDAGPAFALAAEAARQAVRDAFGPDGILPHGTGLIVATTKAETGRIEAAAKVTGAVCPGRGLPGTFARDLALELGATGPVLAVSNACASGTIALLQAARILSRGQTRHVLCVGVDIVSDFVMSGFTALRAMSERPCRPFDAARDGLSVGEGAAAVLLTSDADSVRSAPWALQGWGSSNDANHITGPSRDGSGLALAMRRALHTAGVAPGQIEYLSAHGTGTVYNDAMEAKAFAAVFGSDSPPVSSVKGYIGHTMGAAGLVEAVLCTHVIAQGLIPATLGLEDVGVDEPLRLLSRHLDARVDRALSVNSGFGGVNAAVVIGRAA